MNDKEKIKNIDNTIKKDSQVNMDSINELEQKLEKQQGELELCQNTVQEWKDKFLHVSADFQNFKQRVEKERGIWARTAQVDILQQLLPVIDDFDRALEQCVTSDQQKGTSGMHEGFVMIHKVFHTFLTNCGVKQIDSSGEFNPEYHEAIMQVDSPDHQAGQIVDVMQKGYLFKQHVLRPAKVSVAK